MKFRAIINKNTIIFFDFKDLADPKPLFSIRELLKPWLAKDNEPDRFTGLQDSKGNDIYENDIIAFTTCEGFYNFDIIGKVYFGEHAKFEIEKLNFECSQKIFEFEFVPSKYSEILGNVHQNPELLEVKK